jgi:hypothetical protein
MRTAHTAEVAKLANQVSRDKNFPLSAGMRFGKLGSRNICEHTYVPYMRTCPKYVLTVGKVG